MHHVPHVGALRIDHQPQAGQRLRAQARETVSTVTTFLEDMRVRHGTQATEIRRLRAAITGAETLSLKGIEDAEIVFVDTI